MKRWYYSPPRRLVERKVAADSKRNILAGSAVITNSQYSKSLLAEHYGVESQIVYPGIRTDIFAPQPVPKAGYVLAVGALIYSKGYRFLVEALHHVRSDRRPKLFVAANSVDPEEERTVRGMAARLGVHLHIETITNDQRLAEVNSQARAFVYAPMQEALGMAPLEAAACGTPAVAVAEGGVRETIVDGVTGWLVERDPRVFAERLDSLLSDPATQRRMGEAAAEHVRSGWTWQRAVDKLESHFRLVVGSL